ncbi:MAG: lactonase family protein [Clostridiaceae bacterium]|nr:lactonase family protein [Clostridiaceae bacterium]
MNIFIGTATRLGGLGIVSCSLDEDRLRLIDTAMLPNPTYLILSGNQKTLYAVSSDSVRGEDGGSVAAYRIKDGKPVLQSRQNTGSAGPCFLCLSDDERFLYAANYHGGSLSVFPVDEDQIGERIQLIGHEGHGPNPARQQSPHVHQVSFIPGTHLLCVIDLGIDAVMIYEQDPVGGMLKLAGRLDCRPGSGPRHIAYGPEDKAYLANELGNSVCVLQRANKSFQCLQTLSTLPDNWQGDNTCAAIRTDGQQVYVSNRGHDSLAVYRILGNGLLARIGVYKTGGGIPRDFVLLGSGRILVAHQDGDVALLTWHPDRGLTQLTEPLPVAGAVCVCPLVHSCKAGKRADD